MTAWNLSLALVATLSLCYLFRFDAGARSAMAATIIIMLHEEGRHFWDSALTRVVAVMAGCLLGLIITFLFHARIRKEKNTGDTANEA
jgi:uncharacterized membrane protein YgaE (UPF0421/DUF939 family)